jgi:hypothetical protein
VRGTAAVTTRYYVLNMLQIRLCRQGFSQHASDGRRGLASAHVYNVYSRCIHIPVSCSLQQCASAPAELIYLERRGPTRGLAGAAGLQQLLQLPGPLRLPHLETEDLCSHVPTACLRGPLGTVPTACL